MENEDRAQPTADSMTSQVTCYYSNCDSSTKWAVASSVAHRNPDGSPLSLYTCDDHYSNLTNNLRRAGTKYTLSPINGPHMTPPEGLAPEMAPVGEYEIEFSSLIKHRSIPYKVGVFIAITLTVIIIGPPMLIYYGAKSLLARLGWIRG